jgi:hypothetical protein
MSAPLPIPPASMRLLWLKRRLIACRPSRSHLLVGAPVWGLLMMLSAAVALYLRHRLETFHLEALLLLYFAGGFVAWPFCLTFGRFLAHRHRIEGRFAAFFLCLSAGTILMTAFLFAMQYRLFYAQWHAPPGTFIWAIQFVVTSASAVYQFSVLGLSLFLPLGLLFLIAASLVLARRMR